jgi:hypothetical protein
MTHRFEEFDRLVTLAIIYPRILLRKGLVMPKNIILCPDCTGNSGGKGYNAMARTLRARLGLATVFTVKVAVLATFLVNDVVFLAEGRIPG